MRHSIVALSLLVALLAAASASAGFQPIRRDFGELTVPRLQAGTIRIPPGHAGGRVRVIVTLALPPLAAARGRDLQAAGSLARLNARSASARAYLARIDIAQRAAIARLRAAIPEARVTRRFRIVLDGLTVELPVKRLGRLVALGWLAQVYPSLHYRLRLNRSPSIIGTDVMHAATGADGAGVKIGVVDDGVDQTNPFFAPAGFSPPAGFPKGDLRFATAKVIVARSFPGPGSGAGGQLPVDRSASFHGTHVAGIAAGNAGTHSPGGADHPPVTALSGVAPRAWIGNYRVFTVPTPIGHLANTPEIVAAFEAAVADGMDVINFSGGGPQIDPASDAMNETVRNVAAAGVVPVISAGNDREDFGLGTVGSPSVAPEAISVAATSNLHMFAPALRVTDADAPDFLREVPFAAGANARQIPADWPSVPHVLVDVGTVVGAGGTPVDRTLCGSSADPNDPRSNPLPPGSLSLPGGAIALVSRGICTFVSKAERAQAAGAIGMIVVDNREGEANPISVPTPIPAGMISNLDGARLRAHMATRGGATHVLIGRTPLEIATGRGGIVASFSSAGPTAFGHLLKPDVAAPGASILSATLPEFSGGSPFAVFDGTSMAAPHVAGAAALLVQRHPGWTAKQVKSALTSTAGSAWANTGRTREAPVLLEGGGLVHVPRADDPLIFTEPTSLSFGDLNVNRGAQTRELLLRVSDAGGGGGMWEVELAPQSASPGAVLTAAPVAVPPGGAGDVRVTASAAADGQAGDDYGFIVLRRGDVTRRVPYLFLVTRPGLEAAQPSQLARVQSGTTVGSQSRASVYRFPAAPFGPPPDYTGAPMDEDGAERVYVTRVDQRVANIGVAVETSSQNALIHPFLLGSLDENDVQGYAGTPTNVNPLMFDFRVALGAAGVSFPPQKTYYVSVESGRELFTGRSRPGSYRLRSWVNDLEPPGLSLLTTTVAAGRPTIVVRAADLGAGVDPLSIVIAYGGAIVGAAAYDPDTGVAVIPLPVEAPALLQTTPATLMASDYQEAKNVNTEGANIMPNTTFRSVSLRVVSGPVATWIRPAARACANRPREQLLVAASSRRRIREVRFFDGSRRIRTVRRGVQGLYATSWPTARLKRGKHRLAAVAVDAAGRTARATRTVRVCPRPAP